MVSKSLDVYQHLCSGSGRAAAAVAPCVLLRLQCPENVALTAQSGWLPRVCRLPVPRVPATERAAAARPASERLPLSASTPLHSEVTSSELCGWASTAAPVGPTWPVDHSLARVCSVRRSRSPSAVLRLPDMALPAPLAFTESSVRSGFRRGRRPLVCPADLTAPVM